MRNSKFRPIKEDLDHLESRLPKHHLMLNDRLNNKLPKGIIDLGEKRKLIVG